MQFNRFLEAVRLDLWSLRKLGVRRVQQALLSLLPYNMVDEFVPMMRECLRASKRDTELLEYLKVMDLLLEHPVYNQVLHTCLIEFYPKIVSYLANHGHRGELEEAKIIRKYWVRRIHPNLYLDLKGATLMKAGVDIDYLCNSDAISHIQHYYSTVLCMPAPEIHFHLPQLITQQFYQVQQSNGLEKGGFKSQKSDSKCNPEGSSSLPTVSNDLIANNKSLQYKQNLPDFAIGKRARYCSQETNGGDSVDRFDYCRKILPNRTNESLFQNDFRGSYIKRETTSKEEQQIPETDPYESSLPEVLNVLQKLRVLNSEECQECGLRFSIPEQLKIHKEKHVMDKLSAFEERETKKTGTFVDQKFVSFRTQKEWGLQEIDLDEVAKESLPLQEITDNEFDLSCSFCGEPLEQELIDDQWRLKNAVCTFVSPPCPQNRDFEISWHSIQKSYMHATCGKILIKEKASVESWSIRVA